MKSLVAVLSLTLAWAVSVYAKAPPPDSSVIKRMAAETAIADRYEELGGASGFLGGAVSPVTRTADTSGYYQRFTGGTIYWTGKVGAFSVRGDILAKWADLGWQAGFLGFPQTDEIKTPDGVGRFNHFQGGSIYWKPNLGAHAVGGSIRDLWASTGWERNVDLGYPISDVQPVAPSSADRFTDFENGVVYAHNGDSKAKVLPRAVESQTRAKIERELAAAITAIVATRPGVSLIADPTIKEVSDYTVAGGNVQSRTYRVGFELRHSGSALGMDTIYPDPTSAVDLSIIAAVNPATHTVELGVRDWRANTRTVSFYVPTVDKKLAAFFDPLRGIPLTSVKLSPIDNCLAAKVMKNGDLNVYAAPLYRVPIERRPASK